MRGNSYVIRTDTTYSEELTIDEKKKKIINKEKAASELEKIKDAIYVSGILAQVVSTYGDHMQSWMAIKNHCHQNSMQYSNDV